MKEEHLGRFGVPVDESHPSTIGGTMDVSSACWLLSNQLHPATLVHCHPEPPSPMKQAVCPERVRKILGVPPRSSCRRHDCSVMMEDANYLGLLFDESESTPP